MGHLNGTGVENTLWRRTECNIRNYYCSEPSEAQGTVHPALNTTGPSPVCCHLLFSVVCDGITADDVGVGDAFPSHAHPSLWSPAQSTFLVTPSCWCYCLLPLPAMGDGPTQFNSCLLGEMLMVARVKEPVREPPLRWHNHCWLKMDTEKVL